MWYRKARRSEVLEPDATGDGVVENAQCAAGPAGDDVAGVHEDVPVLRLAATQALRTCALGTLRRGGA